jgi:cytochrome oxidase assembly protein ShyY1
MAALLAALTLLCLGLGAWQIERRRHQSTAQT